jgi:hypothetical protein
MDVGEGVASKVQVAHYERRPPLGEDLRAFGDGTVLTVAALHGQSLTPVRLLTSAFFVVDR